MEDLLYELQLKQFVFPFTENLLLFSFIAYFVPLMFVLIFLDEASPKLKKITIGIVLFFSTLTVGGLYLGKGDLAELVQSVVVELEDTKEIEISDILSSTVVGSDFCPHVTLKDWESCIRLEFVSETKIQKLYVPAEVADYKDLPVPMTITYYELTAGERTFFGQYLHLEPIDQIEDRGIYSENWSFGTMNQN